MKGSSNLACMLTARNTNEKNAKLGQMGDVMRPTFEILGPLQSRDWLEPETSKLACRLTTRVS